MLFLLITDILEDAMRIKTAAFCALLLCLSAAKALGSRIERDSYKNDPSAVAAAMGVSLDTALEARKLDLDELLGWIVMRMASHGNCSPRSLMLKRATLSWGEIAEESGTDWGSVTDDTLARAKTAALKPQAPTQEQERRGLGNVPDPEISPEDEP
jgi:hypothetical protein